MASTNQLLEGERIRLTALLDEDIPLFAQWMSDLKLQRLVNPGLVVPVTADDLLAADSWLTADRENPNSYLFAVRTKPDNSFIGVAALAGINMQARYAEFGINLAHPDYQGKGYGADVMMLLMPYGFRQLNLNRIFLTVFSYNARAIQLYDKFGFQYEGNARETVYRDDRYYDTIYMGLLRNEWEAQYAAGE